MTDEELDRRLRGADIAIAPRESFAEALWDRLSAELAERVPVQEISADSSARGGDGDAATRAPRSPSTVARRPYTKWSRLVAVAAVAVLLVVVGAVAVTRHNSRSTVRAEGPSPTSAAAALPQLNVRVVDVAVPDAPVGLVADESGVWTALPSLGAVVNVEPATNRASTTLSVGASPTGVARAAGVIWTTRSTPKSSLVRTDPVNGTATVVIPLPSPPKTVVGGYGALWVLLNSGGLVRVDPATTKLTSISAIPGRLEAIAMTPTAVLVSTEDGRLITIDPADNRVVGSVQVSGPLGDGLAVNSDGTVWVDHQADGTVHRVDPATGTDLATISVGRHPGSLVMSGPYLYVTSPQEPFVVRINSTTNRADGRIDLAHNLVSLASSTVDTHGDLWVAASPSDLVHVYLPD